MLLNQYLVLVLVLLMRCINGELVAEALMKHLNVDVKVGVASCSVRLLESLHQKLRLVIDTMKLNVSSFENISDKTSRLHEKRAAILETVAKIRSCVIMLDLKYDQMIVYMVLICIYC